MEAFDLDEMRATIEPGDHEPIGDVRAFDHATTIATFAPILIRPN